MELIESFNQWAAVFNRKERTVENYRFFLRALIERTGMRNSGDVTPERVLAWVAARRADGVKPQTINSAHCALLAALRIPLALGKFSDVTFRGIRFLRIRVSAPQRLRARHINEDSFVRLCSRTVEIEPRVLLPVESAVLGGMRAGELARAHADDVHMGPDWGWLDVYERKEWGRHGSVKTGSARQVPLCLELRALFAAAIPIARERHGGWLFPSQPAGMPGRRGRPPKTPFVSVKTLSRQLRDVTRGTEWQGTTWPVLRHTRASWWAQANVSLAKIAFFLGNSAQVVEQYYAAFQPGYDTACEQRPSAALMAAPASPMGAMAQVDTPRSIV